jgi:exodeoxyribonuclease-3
MRVISFSADGLREAADRGFYDWLARQDADFVCIQDLRCSEYDLQDDRYFPRDYNAYFFDDVGGKDNGVAIYCRDLPKAIMTGLGFADFDMQGRYIQADFPDLSVGCLLAPTAAPGDDDALATKLQFFELLGPHLQKVRNKRRDYIICGGWQLTLDDRDVEDSAAADGRPGALASEQAWLAELLDNGYADAFRQVSGNPDAFTYWPDVESIGADTSAWTGGWRSDLQIVSEDLRDLVEHAAVYTGERFSRHAPLIVDYDLEY